MSVVRRREESKGCSWVQYEGQCGASLKPGARKVVVMVQRTENASRHVGHIQPVYEHGERVAQGILCCQKATHPVKTLKKDSIC